jgi:hypothetical protein
MRAIRKKTVFVLLAALILCGVFSSCVGYSGNMEARVSVAPVAPIYNLYNKIPLSSISSIEGVTGSIAAGEAVFHAFTSDGERLETLTKDELLSYESRYAEVTSAYYKDQISGDMLLPYMAMLYALESGYERVYFSSLKLTVDDIYASYSYLTCDNPFFESNYNLDVEYLTPPEGDSETPVFYCLYTTVLESGHFERKLQAYEKAKEMVSSMPAVLWDEEGKAEYLYRKLTNTTRYISYDENEEPDYLYDALVLGRSNCDGFANALAMLYNLAGVESVLSIGTDEGKGHAWVTAKLGGSFYHFDPTYDSDAASDVSYGGKLYYYRMSDTAAFALSRSYDADIKDVAPKCPDTSFDLNPADITVTDFSLANMQGAVADALEADINSDDGCLVVACPQFIGASWDALDAYFSAMADEVTIAGTVDAYLLSDRGLMVLYGSAE